MSYAGASPLVQVRPVRTSLLGNHVVLLAGASQEYLFECAGLGTNKWPAYDQAYPLNHDIAAFRNVLGHVIEGIVAVEFGQLELQVLEAPHMAGQEASEWSLVRRFEIPTGVPLPIRHRASASFVRLVFINNSSASLAVFGVDANVVTF